MCVGWGYKWLTGAICNTCVQYAPVICNHGPTVLWNNGDIDLLLPSLSPGICQALRGQSYGQSPAEIPEVKCEN